MTITHIFIRPPLLNWRVQLVHQIGRCSFFQSNQLAFKSGLIIEFQHIHHVVTAS